MEVIAMAVSPFGRELSTLSTPPTVRTSVEASEQANASSSGPGIHAREEKQGGSGGEEGKPSGGAEAVDPAWARALSSRSWCQLGRCAYADLERRGPDRYLAAIGCDGYHASRTEDGDGRVTVRWGLCPRHREWWRRERVRRAAGKP